MFTLQPGDKIGIISPSSPITAMCPNRFKRAKEYLVSKGYIIVEGNLTGKNDKYRSGSIVERTLELNTFIQDKEIKCIMSTIGGMNSNSILPYIDYTSFVGNPKIIIGYSDFTAILLGIYAKTGISTFYGPALVATFGELSPYNEMSYGYFESMFNKKLEFPQILKMPEIWTEERIDWETQDRSKKENKNKWLTIRSGIARGRLIGGNLNTMQGIFGTQYMPEIRDGDILLIEDSLKKANEIERSFSLLKCAGVFDRIGGLILGKHELFDDQGTNRKPFEILLEIIGENEYPILAEFDCCHTHPMFTVPIGAEIEMDATEQKVSIIRY
jgi:muramoyltetrapeptide carboxypeptidase LdcA involved in peptidoglycan recycling